MLGVYHLLDAMEALAMEAKCLFKQDLVLNGPLVWERGEIGQVSQGLLYVVFVPEQHTKSLNKIHKHIHGSVSRSAACSQ